MNASLLERQSTGGAVARVGFEYQDAFVLLNLPAWLSQGAFSHVVSETIGDVEVCYFSPAGMKRIMFEAKNYVLSALEFWDEIKRFQTVHATSPSEYQRFELVCKDYNSVTSPLLAKLKRLRGVGASFPANSPLLVKGRQEFIDWVVSNGRTVEEAEFVLDYVNFITFSAADSADAAFAGMVETNLRSINLRSKEVAAFRGKCRSLVSHSSSCPVLRAELETALLDVLGSEAQEWLGTPTRLYLCEYSVPMEELGLVVGQFNALDRMNLTNADWQILLETASAIGAFVEESRGRRCIALDGKQRMSLACVLGFIFSAARGFFLHIEHNGAIYRTDLHDKATGRFFNPKIDKTPSDIAEGVVSIGFPTPVGEDISLVATGSERMPCLSLESTGVLDSPAALNLAVAEAKAAITCFRSTGKLSRVHLIVKAPSVFAVALGHRINGIGPIQLYDWVKGGYMPTASLSDS